MNSQFLNGHPPAGPRSENPNVSQPGYSFPGQPMNVPGRMPMQFVPPGNNFPGQLPSGPQQGKTPYAGPPSAPHQSNDIPGTWESQFARDVNGLPREQANPNQLSSDFGSMHIGKPGPQWAQGPPDGWNRQAQPGHPPPPFSNSGADPSQPLCPNSFPPQPPPSSNAFAPQTQSSFPLPPQPTTGLPAKNQQFMPMVGQPASSFPQPSGPLPLPHINSGPTSFPPGSHSATHGLPVNQGPLQGPPNNQLPMHGPPAPQGFSHGQPTNQGPLQGPPASQMPLFGVPGSQGPMHGPPGSQVSLHNQPSLPPQHSAAPNYPGNQHYNAFNNPLRPSYQEGPITSQPYPPHSNAAGFPAGGYPAQRARFPGPSPDGSYGGAPGFPQGPPYLNQGSSISQPPAKRLDPDHMPSQIQVIEDDRRNKGGQYQTGERGSVPPLVTTNFVVEDQGTCSPRFLRASMYNIPCSGDLLKQSHMPMAVALTPFARLHPRENPPPVVDLGQMGPVRCNRCKAYMCPGMTFVDGGRKFQCCFCSCISEVPPGYFAHLDNNGKRIDCYARPELCLGAYEFVATSDYCKDGKLPQAPAFIFMIDVSYHSVKSGLVNLLCARLKQEVLNHLPKDFGDEESEVRVGFATYARELHFYNIKSNLAQPQMLVVSDVNDVFVPLVDGFLVKLSESEALIDSLLVQISQMFCEPSETDAILGPVIQAGLDALKSSERSGKLIIFHGSMPSSEAPGKLKMREDKSLLGTDKEKVLLTPQNNFYTKLGQECVAAGCSVDLFLFPNSYVDVATISEVPRLTGGSLYKYNYFQADLDGDMLLNDLRSNVERQIAFDVVLRLRTSTGIRPVDFLGSFFMSNTTDVELASLDKDRCMNIEIKHDDKLTEAEGAYMQAAVLYTSVGGRRRLRILNAAFTCCAQVVDLFRSCELDALINYLAKLAVRESLNSSVKQAREHLTNRCVQILACYRKNSASSSSSGQLILPECLKLLPMYVNSVLKSGLFQHENINTDDRSYHINSINSMNVSDTVAYFYPRLLPLHELDLNSNTLPTAIRCSYERLKDNGAYLLENGLVMFLWVGLSISADWVQQVFGVPSVAQVDIDRTKLQSLDNLLSARVRGIVKKVREERHRHMKLIIVRQRDKLEPVMQSYLVEDKTPLISSSLSYVDFLCHIHKEIRNLLI